MQVIPVTSKQLSVDVNAATSLLPFSMRTAQTVNWATDTPVPSTLNTFLGR